MQALPKSKADKLMELKALNDLIAERKRYYREQEALITELVECGNTQLMGLNHDILLANQELRGIKTDIRTAAQDKVLLNEDLDIIRKDIELIVVNTTFVGVSPAFG
jgi:hypothetical protein